MWHMITVGWTKLSHHSVVAVDLIYISEFRKVYKWKQILNCNVLLIYNFNQNSTNFASMEKYQIINGYIK